MGRPRTPPCLARVLRRARGSVCACRVQETRRNRDRGEEPMKAALHHLIAPSNEGAEKSKQKKKKGHPEVFSSLLTPIQRVRREVVFKVSAIYIVPSSA